MISRELMGVHRINDRDPMLPVEVMFAPNGSRGLKYNLPNSEYVGPQSSEVNGFPGKDLACPSCQADASDITWSQGIGPKIS